MCDFKTKSNHIIKFEKNLIAYFYKEIINQLYKFSTNDLNINWISTVRKNTTLSTNFLRLRLSCTNSSMERSIINTAFCLWFSFKFHITIFTPLSSPRISYEPVISMFWISTITNKIDSMINVNIFKITASIKNTTFIRIESWCINRNRYRSKLSNCS